MTSSLAVDNTENNQNVIIRYEPMHNPKLWPDNFLFKFTLWFMQRSYNNLWILFSFQSASSVSPFHFLPGTFNLNRTRHKLVERNKIVNACSWFRSLMYLFSERESMPRDRMQHRYSHCLRALHWVIQRTVSISDSERYPWYDNVCLFD